MTIHPKSGLQVFVLQDFASAAPPNSQSGVDAHRIPRENFHTPDGCTGGNRRIGVKRVVLESSIVGKPSLGTPPCAPQVS